MEGILAHFGYVAVFAALLAAGLGAPLPEEVTQLTTGVLAHRGVLRLPVALGVVWAGIVCGDAALFLLARRLGPRALERRAVTRVLTPARREALERHFGRHAFLTVAVARHTGGVRVAAFALAAVSRVKLRTFVVADGLSALLSVPIVVGAGYLFSRHVGEARRDVRLAELAILAVVAVAVGVAVALRRRRARRGSSPEP